MDSKTKLEITARRFLAEQFDPDHNGGAWSGFKITAEERARRDEYRKYLGQWRHLHEPD